MPDKKIESMEQLVEQVIFLTRRVHELERRLNVPAGAISGHALRLGDKLYFGGGSGDLKDLGTEKGAF